MWRELLEAATNASARYPLPISVDRPIRRMRGLALVGRIVGRIVVGLCFVHMLGYEWSAYDCGCCEIKKDFE